MKFARRWLPLLLFLILLYWLGTVFFPSPEKAIRQHLQKTARTASFKENEGAVERLANIADFGKRFSEDVQVQFETPGGGTQSLTGRLDIMRAAGVARGMTTALQVEILDPSVTISPDKQTATADVTVRAKVPGDREFFVQEIKLQLKKFGRSWLIVRAETVKTLTSITQSR